MTVKLTSLAWITLAFLCFQTFVHCQGRVNLAINRRPTESKPLIFNCSISNPRAVPFPEYHVYLSGPDINVMCYIMIRMDCVRNTTEWNVDTDWTDGMLSSFVVTINAINASRDRGLWRCDFMYTGEDRVRISHIASSLDTNELKFTPSLDTLPALVDNTDVMSVTAETPCARPPPITKWKFVSLRNDTSGELNNTNTTTLNNTCPPGESQTRHTMTLPGNTVQFFGKKISLKFEIEHDSFDPPMYTQSMTSKFITFPVPVSSVDLTNITCDKEKVRTFIGQRVWLTCVTSTSYPQTDVSWIGLPSGDFLVRSTHEERDGLVVTTSHVIFTASMSLDGAGIYCRASNLRNEPFVESKTAKLKVWDLVISNSSETTGPLPSDTSSTTTALGVFLALLIITTLGLLVLIIHQRRRISSLEQAESQKPSPLYTTLDRTRAITANGAGTQIEDCDVYETVQETDLGESAYINFHKKQDN